MGIGSAAFKAAAVAAAAVVVLVAAPPPANADSVRDAQWHLNYLRISEAHKITKGAGVTVAVIDTGVDADHPDLKGSILPGTNLTILKEGSPVGWTDEDGHGTGMAGLIAAHGAGSKGALGIAPEAQVLPIRLRARDGDAVSGVEQAIQFAVDHGAKVISMSFGGPDSDALEQETVDAAKAADVVLVAAIGNKPKDSGPGFPASYSGVIAIGGVDRKGRSADVSITDEKMMLSAPAVDIMSTNARSLGEAYRTGTGTSGSTAIVAGAAALVRAKFPQLTADQVVERLTSTAIDKGPKGRDPEYGYGIVNVVGALTAPVEATLAPTAAAPTAPDSAADDSSGGDGPPIGMIAVVGGLLLLVVAVVALIALMRNRRSAA